jgi:hypothetical protein
MSRKQQVVVIVETVPAPGAADLLLRWSERLEQLGREGCKPARIPKDASGIHAAEREARHDDARR